MERSTLKKTSSGGDQPLLRPIPVPGGSACGSHLGGREGLPVPSVPLLRLWSLSAAVLRRSPQSSGGEGLVGEALTSWGGPGLLVLPSCHQQLLLSACSEGGAANWRLGVVAADSPCGTSWTWMASCYNPETQGRLKDCHQPFPGHWGSVLPSEIC